MNSLKSSTIDWQAAETELSAVASLITQARIDRGWTQKDLAAHTGLQRSNISRLESGSYNPSLELLLRVTRGLSLELHVEFRGPIVHKNS